MGSDPPEIRIAELPIFKRYSLAVRNEFASPKEVLALLERSSQKVAKLLEVEAPNSDGAPALKPARAASVKKAKVPKPVKTKRNISVVAVSSRGLPVAAEEQPKSKSVRAVKAKRK